MAPHYIAHHGHVHLNRRRHSRSLYSTSTTYLPVAFSFAETSCCPSPALRCFAPTYAHIDMRLNSAIQESTRPAGRGGKRPSLGGGSRGGAGESRSSAAAAAADRWDSPSSYSSSSRDRDHERDHDRDRDRDRVRRADSSGGSSRTTGSKAASSSSTVKKDITSEQLFDFLNDSSSSSSSSSSSKKSSASTSGASEKPGVSSASERRAPDKVVSASADRAAKLLAARDGSASAVESSGDDPVTLKATCVQLDDENKLLRREVTALSDEVGSSSLRSKLAHEAEPEGAKPILCQICVYIAYLALRILHLLCALGVNVCHPGAVDTGRPDGLA